MTRYGRKVVLTVMNEGERASEEERTGERGRGREALCYRFDHA